MQKACYSRLPLFSRDQNKEFLLLFFSVTVKPAILKLSGLKEKDQVGKKRMFSWLFGQVSKVGIGMGHWRGRSEESPSKQNLITLTSHLPSSFHTHLLIFFLPVLKARSLPPSGLRSHGLFGKW